MILLILVLLGAGYYFTTPAERVRLVQGARRAILRAWDLINRFFPESGPFADALCERTRWPIVTPALVAINAAIFVVMLFGAGAFGDPETLIRWGGNFGPRTTNGEWGRLVTALFVHSGILHLLANVAGLVQIGLIMERLFGRLAFAAVYFAAGALSSLVSLFAHPVTVSVGASGAIFGVYGLLLAALIAGGLRRSALAIPLKTVIRVAPAAGVFVLYSVTAGFDGAAELAGFATGFACGLVLVKDVSERTAALPRVAAAMGVAIAITLAAAIPLRGIANVRPEIERVVAAEDRTAHAYETAVRQFHNGQITADGLVHVIDRTIVPDLQAVRAHLKELERVPREHEPLVASADEYLQLREASWRVRSEALRKTNLIALRNADKTEMASLKALARIKPTDQR